MNDIFVKSFFPFIIFTLLSCTDNQQDMDYEIVYEEQEAGTDIYEVIYAISDGRIRIDTAGDESGYIIYDDQKKQILSISHLDKTVLVIDEKTFDKPELKQIKKTYEVLKDAPAIDGHPVFSYTEKDNDSVSEEICVSIQLAENLLPEVSGLFRNYYRVLSGQLAQSVDAIPEEYRTPCYLAGQVYNTGDYYQKGFPVIEHFSNGKIKSLKSYKPVELDEALFLVPEGYRRFSIDEGLPVGS